MDVLAMKPIGVAPSSLFVPSVSTATGTAKPVDVDCRLRWPITVRGSPYGPSFRALRVPLNIRRPGLQRTVDKCRSWAGNFRERGTDRAAAPRSFPKCPFGGGE